MKDVQEVIVVGAGHAGLSISYLLTKHNIRHLVLERGEVGQSWRTQRWNTFQMVTPNKANILPGQQYPDHPLDYSTAESFFNELVIYAEHNTLPVRCNCSVTSITKLNDEFIVTTDADQDSKIYCRQVVIASGSQNKPVIPSFAKNISSGIHQLHSSQYRNETILAAGGILVVGSGQSGFQISQDLISAGRSVFLSTSRVGRIPRVYRGQDVVDWLIRIGFYDSSVFMEDDGINKPITNQPQVFGNGSSDDTGGYHWLYKRGVQLMGDIEESIDPEGCILKIKTTLQSNIEFASNYTTRITALIDKYIEEQDSHNIIDEKTRVASLAILKIPEPDKFDLCQHNIKTIIWATGFEGDFSFIKLPVFENGKLKQESGLSDIAGLYYLGLPWMRKRKSGIILGVCEDAEFIMHNILEKLYSKSKKL